MNARVRKGIEEVTVVTRHTLRINVADVYILLKLAYFITQQLSQSLRQRRGAVIKRGTGRMKRIITGRHVKYIEYIYIYTYK